MQVIVIGHDNPISAVINDIDYGTTATFTSLSEEEYLLNHLPDNNNNNITETMPQALLGKQQREIEAGEKIRISLMHLNKSRRLFSRNVKIKPIIKKHKIIKQCHRPL